MRGCGEDRRKNIEAMLSRQRLPKGRGETESGFLHRLVQPPVEKEEAKEYGDKVAEVLLIAVINGQMAATPLEKKKLMQIVNGMKGGGDGRSGRVKAQLGGDQRNEEGAEREEIKQVGTGQEAAGNQHFGKRGKERGGRVMSPGEIIWHVKEEALEAKRGAKRRRQ